MKSKTVVCAILALTLSSGGFSFAQGNSQHNDRGRNDEAQQERGRDQERGQQRGRGPGNEQRGDRGERGAGPDQSFYRGQRLPAQYRGHQYVVDDWRGHRLSAPPRGYHWVQNGGDYLLVAITTGVILQLLLNH